jgi:hypothetical protein
VKELGEYAKESYSSNTQHLATFPTYASLEEIVPYDMSLILSYSINNGSNQSIKSK